MFSKGPCTINLEKLFVDSTSKKYSRQIELSILGLNIARESRFCVVPTSARLLERTMVGGDEILLSTSSVLKFGVGNVCIIFLLKY